MVVQLKREIGKLWEDIEKAPYKILFNPSISGLYIWRCVQIQREIDVQIKELADRKENRENSLVVHGNRVIAHLVFREINMKNTENPGFDFDNFITNFGFKNRVDVNFDLLLDQVTAKYGLSTPIPTLFKNVSKCTEMVEDIIRNKTC